MHVGTLRTVVPPNTQVIWPAPRVSPEGVAGSLPAQALVKSLPLFGPRCPYMEDGLGEGISYNFLSLQNT